MANRSLVFIGIRGSVLALDRASGSEVWRADLPGGGFVNVVLDGGDIFATTRGEIFCLDAATGALRWTNKLVGLGRGMITIGTGGGQQMLPIAEELRRQEEAAAAAGAATS